MNCLRRVFWIPALLCASTAIAGGTAVTNGFRVYNSPKGFFVSYGAPLSLHVQSDSAFAITNENLVKAAEEVSQISFVVNKKQVKSAEEVRALLQKEFPAEKILPTSQPGAKGFYWEEKTPAHLQGHYDLLTSNGDFVEISIDANTAGDGIAWITPIVHSFTYDVTAPVLLEFHPDNYTWHTGSTQRLHFHLTDDYSGVKQLTSLRFDQVDDKGLQVEDGQSFFLNEDLISEGNDWYSWTFPVGAYLPPGKYVLRTIYAFDYAGNALSLVSDNQNPARHYDAYPAPYKGPTLPVLTITVVNDSGKVDSESPEFHGFRPPTESWKAGSTHRVYFRITDNLSGVKLDSHEDCIGQMFATEKQNGVVPTVDTKCVYHAEGNDWYSADYTIPKFQGAGTYGIGWIRIEDNADNSSQIFFGDDPGDLPIDAGLTGVFRVQITNDGPQDVTPPVVLDWRVDSEAWHPGETQKVHVKVTDDLSGLAAIDWIVFSGPNGQELHSYPGLPVAEGGDWYSIAFDVDKFSQAGPYVATAIHVTDHAQNYLSLRCQGTACKGDEGGPSATLPELRVQLVR